MKMPFALFCVLIISTFSSLSLEAQDKNDLIQEKTLEQSKLPSTKDTELLPKSLADELKIAEEQGDSRFFQEFMNMLVTLGILVAALMLCMWIFKRMFSVRIQQINETSVIKILERRTLTPKSTIFILNVLGKTVAVAESANGITLLSELPSVKLQGDPGQVRGKEHEK